MKTQTSATMMLGATFLLGVALGGLGAGALAERQRRAQAELGREGGFVAEMERVLAPESAQQWAELLPYLEATDQTNRRIVEEARDALRDALLALESDLDPLLTDAQKASLERSIRRSPDGGGPGIGPPPGPGQRRPPPGGGRPPREGPGR